MDKWLKKGLIISFVVLLMLTISVLASNIIVKNKLKNSLHDISDHIRIQYQDIRVNSLTGSLDITQPKVLVYGKTTGNLNTEIALNQLSISNVSYWNYIFNDMIAIDEILLDKPNVIYYHNDQVDLNSQKSFLDTFDKTIEIESFKIVGGEVEIFNVDDDSLLLKSENVHLEIDAVAVNPSSIKSKIPFTFMYYQLSYANMFYQMNDYENLFIERAHFDTDFYKIQDLVIKTKYSEAELSNQISVERDHFNLAIDSVLIKGHEFGVKSDSVFYFDSNQINVYQPDFKIYRNKLIEDDLTYKPLYSKSLRNLNFEINVEHLNLSNALIVYKEKVKDETNGGVLEFSNLNATINNLNNTLQSKDFTSINIVGVFMKNTPLKVDWNFNINDSNDEFIFKADIGNLNAEHMNQFMEPNLNVALEGEVNQTYFTINGNEHTSRIDLKLRYDSFDIVILKQDGKGKNKFLSALVNLFVSSDSHDKYSEFRYGNSQDVERDKTKSVFNYLWLNIKAGLLNAMTGDGKKN